MDIYKIRRATVEDAAIIARHRVRMFEDMGELPADAATVVESASHARLLSDLASGRYIGWFALVDGKVVGGAGIVLHDYYPTRTNPTGRPTACIFNVYTDPEHRRQGIARGLILEILAWCRAHDIPRASLHASAFGRSLYEEIGFRATNEMRIDIESQPRRDPCASIDPRRAPRKRPRHSRTQRATSQHQMHDQQHDSDDE